MMILGAWSKHFDMCVNSQSVIHFETEGVGTQKKSMCITKFSLGNRIGKTHDIFQWRS